MTAERRRAVVVTGASTGIGAACARYLNERGLRVFATVRKQSDAERRICPGRALDWLTRKVMGLGGMGDRRRALLIMAGGKVTMSRARGLSWGCRSEGWAR